MPQTKEHRHGEAKFSNEPDSRRLCQMSVDRGNDYRMPETTGFRPRTIEEVPCCGHSFPHRQLSLGIESDTNERIQADFLQAARYVRTLVDAGRRRWPTIPTRFDSIDSRNPVRFDISAPNRLMPKHNQHYNRRLLENRRCKPNNSDHTQ